MATGKSQTWDNGVLDWLLGGATPTRPTTRKVALHATAPTNTTAGTELSGTGYTAGGLTCAFGAAAAGSASGPSSGTLQWTNGTGGNWTIVGSAVHQAAGAPAAADILYWVDSLNVVVPDSAILEIATNGVTLTET